jgi:hypothetical protein
MEFDDLLSYTDQPITHTSYEIIIIQCNGKGLNLFSIIFTSLAT